MEPILPDVAAREQERYDPKKFHKYSDGGEFFPSKCRKLARITKKVDLRLSAIKHNIYDIGTALLEAKAILPHGQYKRFIQDHWGGDLSYQTAWLYVSICKTLEYHRDLIEGYPLTVLMDVRKLPKEIVALVKDNPDEFRAYQKQIMEVYKTYRSGEIEVDEFVLRYQKIVGIEPERFPGDYKRVREGQWWDHGQATHPQDDGPQITRVWAENGGRDRIVARQQKRKNDLIVRLRNQLRAVGETSDLLFRNWGGPPALGEDERKVVLRHLSDDLKSVVAAVENVKLLLATKLLDLPAGILADDQPEAEKSNF